MDNGVTNTIRKYNKDLPDRNLKESTVRTWVTQYKRELELKKSTGIQLTVPITKLEYKRRGRPSLMPEDVDTFIKEYIEELRRRGGVINSEIVSSAAKGIVKTYDANLLECNGGHIPCSKEWAQKLLKRLGYVKRKANTKFKVEVEEFEAMKAQFLYDIEVIIELEEVPDDLIINWDHTGINYVPTSNWTMAEEGSNRVEIVGLGDKRQITVVLSCSLSGNFLPPQVIYAGKTPRCLPSASFPSAWQITYSENHWANEKTTVQHITKILLPYIKETRQKLSLSPTHAALVIFDRFKGQCTPAILKLLADNNIHFAIIPAHLTDRLQPLDISVNKALKDYLRRQFANWYSEKLCKQIQNGTNKSATDCPIDLSLSTLKPLGVEWLVSAYNYFTEHKDIVINGFVKAGITPRKLPT